jgi:hypothetical protein
MTIRRRRFMILPYCDLEHSIPMVVPRREPRKEPMKMIAIQNRRGRRMSLLVS